jgi:hypothetical protein
VILKVHSLIPRLWSVEGLLHDVDGDGLQYRDDKPQVGETITVSNRHGVVNMKDLHDVEDIARPTKGEILIIRCFGPYRVGFR